MHTVDYLLGLIALLLAAQILVSLKAKSKIFVNLEIPQVAQTLHHAELHKQAKSCHECGLSVVRYDERGVCANCVSEGK